MAHLHGLNRLTHAKKDTLILAPGQPLFNSSMISICFLMNVNVLRFLIIQKCLYILMQ